MVDALLVAKALWAEESALVDVTTEARSLVVAGVLEEALTLTPEVAPENQFVVAELVLSVDAETLDDCVSDETAVLDEPLAAPEATAEVTPAPEVSVEVPELDDVDEVVVVLPPGLWANEPVTMPDSTPLLLFVLVLVVVTVVVIVLADTGAIWSCKPANTVAENKQAASHLVWVLLLRVINVTSFLFWEKLW